MNRNLRKTAFGEKVLNTNLSPDGRDWLTLALDPFHDLQKPIAGYPDADGSQTVVSCYQYSLDITKPAGAAGNWDLHVFTLPIGATTSALQHTETGFDAFTATVGATATAVSTVNAISVDAGQPTVPTSTAVFAPTNYTQLLQPLVPDALAGVSRVVGFGIEAINSSAEIYKQGLVTCYRMPQVVGQSTHSVLTAASVGASQALKFKRAPTSVAEALLLKGTTQWAAEEGAYLVVPLCGIENPLVGLSNRNVMIRSDEPVSIGAHAQTEALAFSTALNAPPIPTLSIMNYQKVVPYCTCGIYFSGLNALSSIRIRVKVYTERAPSFFDSYQYARYSVRCL